MSEHFDTELFYQLQRAGKCGEMQGTGKRCRAPIIDWIPLDPDYPGVERVGACGTHLSKVAERAKEDFDRKHQRRLEQYEQNEFDRIALALKRIGIKVNVSGYYGSRHFRLLNPGEFLQTLYALGVLEKLGFDIYPEPLGPPVPEKEEANAEVHVSS